jgi:endo-1,4-beta-xylanase
MKLSTFVFVLLNLVSGLELTSPTGQTLRGSAEGRQILIGTAVRPLQLSEALYASTLAREFNMLEPEDALKWEIVHPQRHEFDFSQADQVLEFATRHDMKVRGHTLVWHRQNPQWLAEGHYTAAELARILEEHIKTVVGHYRGRVFAWDVVNEAFDEVRPGSLRSTIWRDQPGIAPGRNDSDSSPEPQASSNRAGAELEGHRSKPYAYIEQCFRWAHAADPKALLFYNEAEAETINAKSDAIFSMVRDFRRRGVPIDGVGLQMHIAKPARGCRVDLRQYSKINGTRVAGAYH